MNKITTKIYIPKRPICCFRVWSETVRFRVSLRTTQMSTAAWRSRRVCSAAPRWPRCSTWAHRAWSWGWEGTQSNTKRIQLIRWKKIIKCNQSFKLMIKTENKNKNKIKRRKNVIMYECIWLCKYKFVF